MEKIMKKEIKSMENDNISTFSTLLNRWNGWNGWNYNFFNIS